MILRFRAMRGMTLIELMVALGVAVVVSGMALAIYDQTLKASVKMTTRQAATDYSMLAMNQIVALLEEAVAPSDFDDPAAVKAEFGPGGASFPTMKAGEAGGVYQVIIRNAQSERAEVPIEVKQTLVRARGEAGATIQSAKPLIGRVKDFKIELAFRYATESRPGEPVKYAARLDPGQWPALVEITLEAAMDDYPKEPVRLVTSVIPGRVPRQGESR